MADAVTHVRRLRGRDYLDRLETGIGHPVEQPLTGAEQDGNEIEHKLVDHARRERLFDGFEAGKPALELARVLEAPGVVHLRYRVVR